MSFDAKKVEDVEIARFKNSPTAIKSYVEGKAKLVESGLIHMLRIFARPFTKDGGADVQKAAYSAAYVEGYNKCLDDIVYFEEKYLTESLGKKAIKADFGALNLAISRGHLTKEDINGKFGQAGS